MRGCYFRSAGYPTLVAARHFAAGEPRALFNNGMATSFDYVVTRAGQRFLLNIAVEDQNPAPITVVLNWSNDGKG